MKKQLEVGDVFEVAVEGGKKYMQFIGDDYLELNSSVLRVYKTVHPSDTGFRLSLLKKDEEEFCVHVTDIKQGEREGLWKKVANEEVVHKEKEVFFKGSDDYGNPEVEESKNWYVVRLGDENSWEVDYDDPILQRAYIGNIIQPEKVLIMIKKNGEYQGVYPKHK